MSDEYEPAIESAPEAPEAPEPAAPDTAPEGEPEGPGGPRAPRVVSDRVRAMFRDLASKASADGVSAPADLQPVDLEPAIESAPAAAEVVEAPASSSPAAPTQPAAAAVPPSIDVGKAAAEQARLLQEAREAKIVEREKQLEKAYAEREAKLVEREKRFSSQDLIERPGAALVSLLKDAYGVDGDDLKGVIEDVVTELSEHALGVQLPSELKGKLESRKAVRSVKAYKADLTRQQQQIAEERAAAEAAYKAEQEKQAQARDEADAYRQLTNLVTAAAGEYKFLVAENEDPAGILLHLVKEQAKRGEAVNWRAAAKEADDYFRKQSESVIQKAERLKSLLTPPAPAKAVPATAKAATPPGGTSGLVPAARATPAPTQPADDEPLANVDWRDQRRAKARQLAAKLARG